MKTLKIKVKPSHYSFLNRAAVEMNIAWNQLVALYYSQEKKPSHFDLNKMTTGWAKLHFKDTMQMSLSELAMDSRLKSERHECWLDLIKSK